MMTSALCMLVPNSRSQTDNTRDLERLKMKKLAAHVTFFYIEGRLHWLEEVVNGLKSIGKDDVDVFVHTNKSFSISNAEVIVHNLDGIHPHLLTWLSWPMMEQQLG